MNLVFKENGTAFNICNNIHNEKCFWSLAVFTVFKAKSMPLVTEIYNSLIYFIKA